MSWDLDVEVGSDVRLMWADTACIYDLNLQSQSIDTSVIRLHHILTKPTEKNPTIYRLAA